MTVGGGVCVASPSSSPSSSVEAAWGATRTTTTGARHGAAVAAARQALGPFTGGPGASGGLAEDPYRTLRLCPGATHGEVKKSFRRLALIVRPAMLAKADKSGEAHLELCCVLMGRPEAVLAGSS
ncbi:hypothetical protein BDA96_10G155700 [Sorghum bicolor]|uniref:J domain-containing protein n=1 Tax=Sorghum bicolor TaxID=4558 RepID=A0A921U0U3_SORBI|nr:hypothetical protein BDA96_10G155700 [Sorghum bicolor]